MISVVDFFILVEDPQYDDYYYAEYGEEYGNYENYGYGNYEETYNYEDASEGMSTGGKLKIKINYLFPFFRWTKSWGSIFDITTCPSSYNNYYNN